LTKDEWRPYAEGLKALAIKHGLRCDAGLTTDAARVLRPPTTFNYKYIDAQSPAALPVKSLLLREASADYNFVHSLGTLATIAPVTAAVDAGWINHTGPATPAFAVLDRPRQSLPVGLDQYNEMPPLDFDSIIKECAFIRDALNTGGKDYSQPMWNLTTLAATFMANGEKLAHKMGNQHPGYTPESTTAMWERKMREREQKRLGWPSCNAIQAAGCTACAACPHFAKSKSPLNFGLPTVTPDPNNIVGQGKKGKTLLLSSAEFVAGFVPPDYLIDGLMQKRYVYSLTAPTGAGKTCITLYIAMCVALGMKLAGLDVEKGCVLFFAGENPDDVRSRWIKLCEVMGVNPDNVDMVFMPGTPPISNPEIRQRINAEAERQGPFSLLIVDTSAAFFQGDDENSNKQLGDHARLMRSFTDLPGGPSVLVTCHPTKNPDMSNLLPRGGGAFLAEVDGNLVAIKQPGNMIVELNTHGKFRGPEFSPISFQIVPGTSKKLVDAKGRSIWTVTATPITEKERDVIDNSARAKNDDLLTMMKNSPGLSLSEYAQALNWQNAKGDINKRAVQTAMTALAKDHLVEKKNDRYWLTAKGKKVPVKATSNSAVSAGNPSHSGLPQGAICQAAASSGSKLIGAASLHQNKQTALQPPIDAAPVPQNKQTAVPPPV
jgi:AAA domain